MLSAYGGAWELFSKNIIDYLIHRQIQPVRFAYMLAVFSSILRVDTSHSHSQGIIPNF